MQFLSLSIDTTPIFRDWLREFLQQHSNLFPWFHVPTTQIVHIKNPTWKTKVFNFHRFLKQWDPEQPPPCQCGGQDFFPTQTIRQTGHLFASMLDIFPYTFLAHLNLEDCTWPTSRQWMEQGQQTFYRWKERWKLPNGFKHRWDLALHQAWESHLSKIRTQSDIDTARHRNLHQEIRMMKRFVLYVLQIITHIKPLSHVHYIIIFYCRKHISKVRFSNNVLSDHYHFGTDWYNSPSKIYLPVFNP